ncbi:hypothetical protein, partial [Luteibacter sp.]|uniref:hypothetical protein n=1 Tax=Luteibacter sp. TaxID=1886636 RepID=UPI002807DF63
LFVFVLVVAGKFKCLAFPGRGAGGLGLHGSAHWGVVGFPARHGKATPGQNGADQNDTVARTQ